MSLIISFVSIGLHGHYNATELTGYCKSVGMDDHVAQLFLQNPDVNMLKKLYQKAAMKAHPDAGGSNEAFVALGKAKDTLVEYANQSQRVSISSNGSYSAGPTSGAASKNSSSNSSSGFHSRRFKSYYSSLDEFSRDLKSEINRLNKKGLKTSQDWKDYAEYLRKLDEYEARFTAASSSSYQSFAGAHNAESAYFKNGSYHKSYDGAYGSSSKTYYYHKRILITPAMRVVITCGAIVGIGYGIKSVYNRVKSLQNYVKNSLKDTKIEDAQSPKSPVKSLSSVVTPALSNKYMKASAGLAVAVALGVAGYKSYYYYQGKTEQPVNDSKKNL